MLTPAAGIDWVPGTYGSVSTRGKPGFSSITSITPGPSKELGQARNMKRGNLAGPGMPAIRPRMTDLPFRSAGVPAPWTGGQVLQAAVVDQVVERDVDRDTGQNIGSDRGVDR